jgi:hypothetical protein
MPKAKRPKKANVETTATAASGAPAKRSVRGTRAAAATVPNPTATVRTRGLRSQVSLSPSVIKNSDKILSGLRTKKAKKGFTPAAVQATEEYRAQEEAPSGAATGESSIKLHTNDDGNDNGGTASATGVSVQANASSGKAIITHNDEGVNTIGDTQTHDRSDSMETDTAHSRPDASATDSDVQADSWTDHMEIDTTHSEPEASTTETDVRADTSNSKANSAHDVENVKTNIESYISGSSRGAHISNGAARDDKNIGEGKSNRADSNVTGGAPGDQAPPSTDHNDGEAQMSYKAFYSPITHLVELVSKKSYVDHAVQTGQSPTLDTRGKNNLTKVDCYVEDCPANVALEGLTLSREELEMIFAHRERKLQVPLSVLPTPIEKHTPVVADVYTTPTEARPPMVVDLSPIITEAHTPIEVYSPTQVYNWTDKRNFTNFIPVNSVIIGVDERRNDAAAIMPHTGPELFTNAEDPRWIEGNADLFRQIPQLPITNRANESTKPIPTQVPLAEYRLPFELDEMPFQHVIEPDANDVDMLADEFSGSISSTSSGSSESVGAVGDPVRGVGEDIGSSSKTPSVGHIQSHHLTHANPQNRSLLIQVHPRWT